jgi:poly(3-hydroxybutyrate) depolymerase
MRAITSIVAFASVCLLPLHGHAQDLNGFEARSFKGTKGLTLPYRLFKVKNPTAGMKYPLILFLHGAGERGDNNTSQLTANAGATVWATDAHQAKHPAYVIAPQCPAPEQWVHTDWTLGSYSTTTVAVSDPLTTALEIADAVATEFGTDPRRQYITGLSMGGYGTWDAITRNPERFAAAIPVCGAGDPTKADLLEMLPLWTFHGDADSTVPVSGSRDMVTALKAVGSAIKYTEYPGVGHNAWDMTYANEEVIDWLFQNEQEPSGGIGGSAGTGGMGGSGAGGSGSGSGAGGGSGSGSGSGGSSGSTSGSTSDAGGTAGGNNLAGTSSSGIAGSANGGSAGTASAGGSGTTVSPTAGEDSSCTLTAAVPGPTRGAWALVLGGCAAFLLQRRRARGAA